MPKLALYNMEGNKIGDIEVSDKVFAQEVNKVALHQVVVNYLANQRQGTQSTKTRSEVRGGGIKPWRQKGTGRARQGSIRAPQWTGGGVALGPKPRSYRFSVNKKLRRLALKSALSTKVAENEIIVIDELKLDSFKTKEMAAILKAFEADNALVVTAGKDDNVVRSAANIPGIETSMAENLNVYDVLKHSKFIVTKDAVSKIEEVYA